MLVILQILQRLLQANLTASEDPSMPTAYVARFIKRILAKLKDQPGADSPGESVAQGLDVQALFNQLDQVHTLEMGGSADAQYWDTLFSSGALGDNNWADLFNWQS